MEAMRISHSRREIHQIYNIALNTLDFTPPGYTVYYQMFIL